MAEGAGIEWSCSRGGLVGFWEWESPRAEGCSLSYPGSPAAPSVLRSAGSPAWSASAAGRWSGGSACAPARSHPEHLEGGRQRPSWLKTLLGSKKHPSVPQKHPLAPKNNNITSFKKPPLLPKNAPWHCKTPQHPNLCPMAP